MHARLIILLAVLISLYLLIKWFLRTPPKNLARALKKAALYGGIALLVVLVVTGRLPWLFALVGAAIPLLQRLFTLLRLLPMIRRVMAMLGMQQGTAAGGNTGGQTSTIRTRYLDMSLDHDTGAMNGTVLEGRFEGRRLDDLDLEQLLELRAECRAGEEQSAAVLEAYLDRTHGDEWRARAECGNDYSPGPAATVGEMTREEAWAVLGVEPDSGEEEIRDAHRRLMQKLHPDRGGSDYLAAKINRAKDLLLT